MIPLYVTTKYYIIKIIPDMNCESTADHNESLRENIRKYHAVENGFPVNRSFYKCEHGKYIEKSGICRVRSAVVCCRAIPRSCENRL